MKKSKRVLFNFCVIVCSIRLCHTIKLPFVSFLFYFFGGVVVVLLHLFMTVIKLNLILKYNVLILKFSNIVHIHNKKLKGVYIYL